MPITYSDSFVQFLKNSDCNIANFLVRLRNKRYYSNLLTTSEIDYLTFRTDGTISYLPAGKEHKVTNGNWDREGRQNGKPSKVIRKILTKRAQRFFKDADFECFTNEYKARYSDTAHKLALLPASEIPAVYCQDTAPGGAGLNSSCMKDECSSYFDIYVSCDALQILTLTNSKGELAGRALVWKVSDSVTLMDRIYVAEDFQFQLFLNYAKANNWYRKESYNASGNKRTFVKPCGAIVDKTFTIYTDTDFSYYPYIDTFHYGSDGTLTNVCQGEYTYNCTDGQREGDSQENENESYDEIAEEYIDSDSAIFTCAHGDREYRNRTTNRENCQRVNGDWYYEQDSNIICLDGTYYLTEETCYIESEDGDFLLEDCTYCEHTSQYELTENCVWSEDIGSHILKSDAIEFEGNFFPSNTVTLVKIDGKYFHIGSQAVYFDSEIGDYCARQLTLFPYSLNNVA